MGGAARLELVLLRRSAEGFEFEPLPSRTNSRFLDLLGRALYVRQNPLKDYASGEEILETNQHAMS